jgi:hypothetical protein
MIMRHTFILIGLSLVGLSSIGCKTVRYMEEETPPGQIPAPAVPIVAPVPGAQVRPPGEGPQSGTESRGVRDEDTSQPSMASGLSAAAKARFQAAYAAKKSPKMVVFLNRQLSDEVREWVTDTRRVVTGTHSETETVDGKETERTDKVGGLTAHTQKHVDSATRMSPNERWMWAFEDGFIQPLLGSGAKMVDRATIMRLVAASSGQQGNAHALLAVKKIEMDALKKHADVFVEILIARSPASLYGYEFKATAKEVNTGIIVASVTSLRWRPEDRRQRRVLATSEGYKVVETIKIPSVDRVACDLATDLMNALTRTWGK